MVKTRWIVREYVEDANEPRETLIGLMAEQKRHARELRSLREEIARYEGYAREALTLGEQDLALDIANRIALLESSLTREEAAGLEYERQVQILRDVLRRQSTGRQRHNQLHGEQLQYLLDVLDAEAELTEGGQWRDLDKKMREAGIIPDEKQVVLQRIKDQLADQG
jgi:phage shock protein A